ncbi:MAG TPA: DoxX family membrane protein, partial [Terriglobales bacterium]|nr:DoxX family membrane protein [Terriglobales bacterium]
GEPDLVQISGGEPTLHPDFFEILDAVRARPIRHVMINTNGLRIASATAFLYHGSAILFGCFAGPGPVAFANSHHWPVIMGYLIGWAQFAGGLAVLFGVLTRLGATCLAIVMIGAIFTVHLPRGFNIGNGGMEYALTQLVIAIALILTGPGIYSLSVWVRKLAKI